MAQISPSPGESALDFVERLVTEGDTPSDFKTVGRHFGLSEMVVKSLWLTSISFNARFSYNEWAGRMERVGHDYGARVALRKRYKLDDEALDAILADFATGNRFALTERLGFEGLAKVLLTETAQEALRDGGFLVDAGSSQAEDS